jgi:hypothetical protein
MTLSKDEQKRFDEALKQIKIKEAKKLNPVQKLLNWIWRKLVGKEG